MTDEERNVSQEQDIVAETIDKETTVEEVEEDTLSESARLREGLLGIISFIQEKWGKKRHYLIKA